MTEPKHITIYTDGACVGNPGRGGYGVILVYGNQLRELSGGYRRTTNNRMEIRAALAGLESLKGKCKVTLYSDSQYLVRAITEGWAKKWRANGWKRNKKDKAVNPDLWQKLLELCEYHDVTFEWVRGHVGNTKNERCDRLATKAALGANLLIDEEYESGSTGS